MFFFFGLLVFAGCLRFFFLFLGGGGGVLVLQVSASVSLGCSTGVLVCFLQRLLSRRRNSKPETLKR